MNRISVIQSIINHIHAKTYLEIGVAKGLCFFQISAPKKIGVDPSFIFSKKRKFTYCLKNPCNIFNKYYPISSDCFFESHAPSLFKHGLDVAFIDGLHTHEQSLKDVENALSFLNKNGVIILHDCNPRSKEAAIPAKSYEEAKNINSNAWSGEWSGDVWKTIPCLRSSHQELDIFVLDCDYGLGIITTKQNAATLNNDTPQTNALTYQDLEKNRENLLNLKNERYLLEVLNK